MSQEPIPSKREGAGGGGDETVALSGKGGGTPCPLTPSVEGWWLSPPPLPRGVSISVALIRSQAASASSTAAGLRIQQKPERRFGLSGPY